MYKHNKHNKLNILYRGVWGGLCDTFNLTHTEIRPLTPYKSSPLKAKKSMCDGPDFIHQIPIRLRA